MRALINSKIVTNGKIIENRNIIFNDIIVDITTSLPDGVEVIDAEGLYVSAGFIDRHIHGAGGYDVMDGTLSSLECISKTIVKTGVTDFLPTTMTMKWEKIDHALQCVREYQGKECGAKILGVHLEGPFINGKYKGAQKDEYIKIPEFKLIENYLDIIRLITYSPELDIDLEFTSEVLSKSNVILAIGHSDCNMDLALKIHDLGVRNITHCFNGMNSFHHRTPGVIGALFVKDFNVEYIADGIHSDIRMLRGFINKMGKNKSILITDSMRATLLQAGEFDLGGQKVIVDEHSAKLVDGTLAGSILTMNKAIKNIISSHITLEEAVAMATENPAKALGIFDVLGSVEKGKRANLVVFNRDIDIKNVIIKGMDVFAEE